ncbi:MAG: HlyC/CorC family transporter [bacterium]|nr:HlyC/CorC family transporter [bacterium]
MLLIFSAFFSGAEIAFMSISDVKVRHLVEKKKRYSRLLEKLKSRPNNLLITVLIGNNLANIGGASLATTLSIDILQNFGVAQALSYGVGITTGVMTLLILIFGEIAPKTYCMHHAESVALTISPIVRFFQMLFYPFSQPVCLILKKTSGDVLTKQYHSVTEDEVKTMVKISEEEGAIRQEEKELIQNVFELDNTEVGLIMTPRVDMFTMESDLSIDEAVKQVQDLEFSRIPVYDDKVDNIVGIAYTKDILRAAINSEGDNHLSKIVKPAIFVPESMMVNVLLEKLQAQKTHIAMVVDEHGGIAGLVSIEDVLEELVGEIYDETDKPEYLFTKVDDTTYKVLGKLTIQELNDLIELGITEDESYDTLSGLVLYRLGHIPEKGEKFEYEGLAFSVEKVEDNRVIEVIIENIPPKEDKEDSKPE